MEIKANDVLKMSEMHIELRCLGRRYDARYSLSSLNTYLLDERFE